MSRMALNSEVPCRAGLLLSSLTRARAVSSASARCPGLISGRLQLSTSSAHALNADWCRLFLRPRSLSSCRWKQRISIANKGCNAF